MMAPVGLSISRMPGPPTGPSPRITTTSPALTLPARMAAVARSSPSNTRAVPVNDKTFLAGDLGHRAFRSEIAIQNDQMTVFLDGRVERLDHGLVRRDSQRHSARFSATVRPVTVRQSPCSSPSPSNRFISGWMPPIAISSDIR